MTRRSAAKQESTPPGSASLQGRQGEGLRVDASWGRQVENALRARGASASEAAEISTDVLGDAEVGQNGKLALLDRASPDASPLPFLIRVAVNRWIDRKRKESWLEPVGELTVEPAYQLYRDLDPAPGEGCEDTITQLLRDAILRTMESCPPADLVLTKLVIAHRVPQEQVAAFLGLSQSTVSRQLSAVLSRLRTGIMDAIHKADPWLLVEWADVIEMCRSSPRPISPFSA